MGFLKECRTLIDGQSYVLRSTTSQDTLRNGIELLEDLLESLDAYCAEHAEKAPRTDGLYEEVETLLEEAQARLPAAPVAAAPAVVAAARPPATLAAELEALFEEPPPTKLRYIAYGVCIAALFVYSYILAGGAAGQHRHPYPNFHNEL
jgi:hypothetical protein